MLLSMEYGDFKQHEADAFELDHVIAYKQILEIYFTKCFDGSQPRKFSPSKITRYMVVLLI